MRKVALLVLLLAGCARPPDVAVSLYQTRSDTPVNKIEMQVQNNGTKALTVQQAQLASTQLSAYPVWDDPVDIPPGTAVDLKVALPPPLCSGAATDEVILTIDDRRLTLPATDTLGQLATYRDNACFRQDVERTGEFRITGLTGDVLGFTTDLTVGPMRSTTLFIPRAQTTDSVRLTPNRCDAHALAEDKQGTYFPIPVTLPDGRTQDYVAGVDQRLRAQLYRLYARLCGL